MKSNVTFLINLLLLLIFVTSCGSKFSLQKRRYTKGFHFSVIKERTNNASEVVVNKNSEKSENKAEIVREEQATVLNVTEANTGTKMKVQERKRPEVSELNSEDGPVAQSVPIIKSDEFEKSEGINKHSGISEHLNQTKSKRSGLLGVLSDIYVGYYVISILVILCVGLYYLFTTYTLTQALTIVGVIALVVFFCYLVGSAVTGF
jgi:hypothetical protein